MRTLTERKVKLETYMDIVEELEKLIKDRYQWQIEFCFDNGVGIENWTDDKKTEYEMLSLAIATVQSFINQIENIKF